MTDKQYLAEILRKSEVGDFQYLARSIKEEVLELQISVTKVAPVTVGDAVH